MKRFLTILGLVVAVTLLTWAIGCATTDGGSYPAPAHRGSSYK